MKNQARIIPGQNKRKLTFTVKTGDEKDWKVPRWTEAEVENTFCPNCGETMTVIISTILYAHCAGPKGCGKYFIGE